MSILRGPSSPWTAGLKRPAVLAATAAALTSLTLVAAGGAQAAPPAAAADAGSVYLSVADGGAGTVPSVVSPTPLARSGRGLGIVHSLTSDWGVKETSDGNTVFGILDRA